jgi:hypothetical protein
MIDTMDTSSFLLALERFLALRPRPCVIIADNGSNFKGGEAALKEKTESDQIDLEKAQSHFNIKFRFAPPRSPHHMGLVERFVQAAKAAIHSAKNAHALSDEELQTLFFQSNGSSQRHTDSLYGEKRCRFPLHATDAGTLLDGWQRTQNCSL